jgi:hypothetical protein
VNNVFVMTHAHLRLLRRMNVCWNDARNAPVLNIVRPYGNSEIEQDIANAIGFSDRYDEEANDYLDRPKKEIEYINLVHRQMQYALQAALDTAQFSTGVYWRDDSMTYRKGDTSLNLLTMYTVMSAGQGIYAVLGDEYNLINIDRYPTSDYEARLHATIHRFTILRDLGVDISVDLRANQQEER